MFWHERFQPDGNSRIRRWRDFVARLLTDESEARGVELLKEWLSPAQRAQFERDKYFEVTGCDTGRRYRIRYATSMNVFQIDDGGSSSIGLCFVPDRFLVPGDVMLAQKIALETSELDTLAIALSFRRGAIARKEL
jgi:hypothetical protein